jgi:hypothetical protein
VNRAERRRSRRAKVRLIQGATTVEQAARCPDCDSNVEIVQIAPGIYEGRVEHDNTCPWFIAFKRDLS